MSFNICNILLEDFQQKQPVLVCDSAEADGGRNALPKGVGGATLERVLQQTNALGTLSSLPTGWIFFGGISSLLISMMSVRNRITLVKLDNSSK